MLRYEDLKDISDGRLYDAEDKALIGTNQCKGCSHCCESDMGVSIVLTPYDIYELTRGTSKSFDELLVGFYVQISIIDGIALPHLKMEEGCKFLSDGRCSVHEFRPGICRLFPLGRLYQDKSFIYFIQKDQCTRTSFTPCTISEWLGIERLEENTAYLNKWHGFLKMEMKKVAEIREMNGYETKRIHEIDEKSLADYVHIIDETERLEELGAEKYRQIKCEELDEMAEIRIKEIMKSCLSIFYMQPYDVEKDFYKQFNERLKQGVATLRKG